MLSRSVTEAPGAEPRVLEFHFVARELSWVELWGSERPDHLPCHKKPKAHRCVRILPARTGPNTVSLPAEGFTKSFSGVFDQGVSNEEVYGGTAQVPQDKGHGDHLES